MEFGRRWCRSRLPAAIVLFLLLYGGVGGTGIFRVRHKFDGQQASLSALRSHDVGRHGRLLGVVDLKLGGIGYPLEAGLYFAEIAIGLTDPKKYYVQIDTGSDILWVNCAGCKGCPKSSELGIKLSYYNMTDARSGSPVYCNQPFCTSIYSGLIPNCTSEIFCHYFVQYGDGSMTSGFFVEDHVQYNQASGNITTEKDSAIVTFGCGVQQLGDLNSSSAATDGVLGFGQANSSMISQLASSGRVKKKFGHCLDGTFGGGIFAIGDIVQPIIVNSTPMVPNQQHYNVHMKAIEVAGKVIDLPTDVFDAGDSIETIVDSGTTLAYLPQDIYAPLMVEIMSYQPTLSQHPFQGFSCFYFIGSVDSYFPEVTLHFDEDLSLTVHPHEYFFQIDDDAWCIGWQNSKVQSEDGKAVTLLGVMVMLNKVVVYDLENQRIGWTDHNCSSSILVQDDVTGSVYSIDSHNLSSTSNMLHAGLFVVLLFLTVSISAIIF